MDMARRHAEAEIRVQRALRLIESAQNELSRAAAELSPLVGAIPLWRRAAKLSDLCHSFWYVLEQHKARRRWYIDGTNAAALDQEGA